MAYDNFFSGGIFGAHPSQVVSNRNTANIKRYYASKQRAVSSTAGGATNPLQAYINSITKAQNEAKAANEARYKEGQVGWNKLESDASNAIGTLGSARTAAIGQKWRELEAKGQADLANRGMHGSTLTPTLSALYKREQGSEMAQHEEAIRREKLGTMVNLRSQRLGAVERRDDTYPDMAMLANLSQLYGRFAG